MRLPGPPQRGCRLHDTNRDDCKCGGQERRAEQVKEHSRTFTNKHSQAN